MIWYSKITIIMGLTRGFEIPTKDDSLARKHNKFCVI